MQNITYLLLRRLRLPLIILICVYAIAVMGLVLIPGMDDQGNTWRMDFFHAIYFVSFLGSTIGFGEIPYPFTDAQRMWVTFIIYAAVITWLYAIGSILTLIQDPNFRRVLAFSSFTRQTRRIQQPFYLICGYGDAGSLLVRELTERGMPCTVIEQEESKLLNLEVSDLPIDVPAITGDATDTEILVAAGLKNPLCKSIIALTGDDQSNLTIAITSKLLTPKLLVICQSDTRDAANNMASFGTDHIIDPFDIFGQRFAMMFHSPSMYLIHAWMTSAHSAPLPDYQSPPKGDWVMCGYGRFGKAVRKHLTPEGVNLRIIEADFRKTYPPEGTVEGRGTEADTLLQADIKSATGIIAGTDSDANNLSILITAKDLKSDLFTVVRQNQRSKDEIFNAANIDLAMQPGTIAAQHILGLIMAPLLDDFLRLAHYQNEDWANILLSRVIGVVEEVAAETWCLDISAENTPAVYNNLCAGNTLTLANLCSDPRDPACALRCVPLLLKRGTQTRLVPDMNLKLQQGDQLLFCGRDEAKNQMRRLTHDNQALYYVRTGNDLPGGFIWRRNAG